MAVNSFRVVKSFQIFENQTVCLLVIVDFKAIEPFTFDNRMKGLLLIHQLTHGDEIRTIKNHLDEYSVKQVKKLNRREAILTSVNLINNIYLNITKCERKQYNDTLRNVQKEYAIVFTATEQGEQIPSEKLLPVVFEKQKVHTLLQVITYWVNDNEYMIDFALWRG